ncbi:MAG: hypothetical protein EOO51_00260 [Flavobacterium sp.]|nr:MAG: hypothetical protein EOO51_00260 [Flavobacterium sp.]
MNILKKDIFSRAKVFIEDMGSFAPFGAKIVNDKIKDVVFDIDEDADFITVDGIEYKVAANEDAFDSEVLIEILSSNFSSEIKNKEIQCYQCYRL